MSVDDTTSWSQLYASEAEDDTVWEEEPSSFLAPLTGNLTSSMRVLDIGCGTGRNLPLLAKAGTIWAQDASQEALDRLEVKPNLNKVQGSIEKLSFDDDFFDLVLASDILGHLRDPVLRSGLQEVHRVLRPGGHFIGNFLSKKDPLAISEGTDTTTMRGILYRFRTISEVKEVLKDFSDIDVNEIIYDDVPHGKFNPKPHQHGYIIFSCKRPS